MHLVNMTILFEILMYSFLGLIISYALVIIIYFLIPKHFLKNHFTPPHFSQTEVIMLSGFPTFFIRTVMFMRLLGFPSSGKLRGLENAYKTQPTWLCKFCKYSIFCFVIFASIFGVCIAISGLDMAWIWFRETNPS